MKHIVSFSGGMGSFAEAYACVEAFGKENVLLLFADTLMEDEDLYRFKDEVVSFLGCEIITLCYGLNIWELFKKEKFIGNSRLDICSRVLKRTLLNDYIVKNYTAINKELPYPNIIYNCNVHLGIDFSEYHRLTEVQRHMAPMIYRSLLVENGIIVPKDYSEKFGIKKPRLYSLGFSHNNCGGFCVKAGLGHFKLLFEKMPERYAWHEQQEQETIAIGGRPFLKKTHTGVIEYISLKKYRLKFLEPGLAEEYTYDIGGCSCALPLD